MFGNVTIRMWQDLMLASPYLVLMWCTITWLSRTSYLILWTPRLPHLLATGLSRTAGRCTSVHPETHLVPARWSTLRPLYRGSRARHTLAVMSELPGRYLFTQMDWSRWTCSLAAMISRSVLCVFLSVVPLEKHYLRYPCGLQRRCRRLTGCCCWRCAGNDWCFC